MNGGESLIASLLAGGVDVGFGVSGESFLPALEAMRRSGGAFRFITTRHESGASFAAEAFAKLSGRPAAVFVSRGPGASNAAIGIHTARQDSTPLLLFIGDVRRASRGTEAFQEIDAETMFASLAKAVLRADSADRVSATVAEAIALARHGRPGPVVVSVARDVHGEPIADARIRTPAPAAPKPPDPSALSAAAARIAAARRPLLIAGELAAPAAARRAIEAFAEQRNMPVMTAYRRQDVFDNAHPVYAGHLEINRVGWQEEALRAADLIVAAGARLDDITTAQGSALGEDLAIVQIFPEASACRLGRAVVALDGDLAETLAALLARLETPVGGDGTAARLHRAYLDFSAPGAVPVAGAVDLSRIAAEIDALCARPAVVLTDGGSFARWIHRFRRCTAPASQAGPMSGAMGYAVPGAIGAALARPGHDIVAFVGDGGFMMTGQELVSAVEQRLAVTVVVCDNAAHGSILEGQRKAYGADADYGTRLTSPDFAAIARGYGVAAASVERTEDFAAAFAEVQRADGPGLVHLRTDLGDIVPFGNEREAV